MKTPTRIFRLKPSTPRYNDSAHFEPVPGCKSKYIWMTMRHGIRYATTSKCIQYIQLTDFRDKIIENVGNGKTKLCIEDVFGFLFWMPDDLREAKPNGLTPNGRAQILDFGKLLKNKFCHLFPEQYDPDKIQIDYTEEEKSIDSVEAMMEALFNNKSLPSDPTGALSKQLYTKCRRPKFNMDWETKQNFTYLMENSPQAEEMCLRVSEKLGLLDEPLDYNNVSILYNACQYELAWGRLTSPWCSVFEKEDLELMEYIGDLSYYYFCGPGNPYNMIQGCLLLKDLILQLLSAAEAFENNLPHHTVSLYMGHSTSVLHIAAQLGIINEEEHLTHLNYEKNSATRRYRTSIVAPYTANLIVILYECTFNDRYQIKILLNEKPVLYPGICDPDTGLCSLHSFQKLFRDFISWEECSHNYCTHSIDQMCYYLNVPEHECNIVKSEINNLNRNDEKSAGGSQNDPNRDVHEQKATDGSQNEPNRDVHEQKSTGGSQNDPKRDNHEQKATFGPQNEPKVERRPRKMSPLNAVIVFVVLMAFAYTVVTVLDRYYPLSVAEKKKKDQEHKQKKKEVKTSRTLNDMEKQSSKEVKKAK
ncbi:multiple inositol polyphosphate phosphatase 1 [Nilaparvata lugens]|uniref:multiple inositol polyphosphate phosphatase 1 n=1 Tax=Nilaparvata lugens TaxID=108931 RepID=UPI00193D6580|nr:multiple inositol polyphosphate phosphatase 1 [Nilaparvata lugens]XP_039289403.1 multiple inositol polyphosphate phosphatase 1 [Nilaparvata lugens]